MSETMQYYYYQQSISGQQAILSGGISHGARPVAPTRATSEKTPSPSNSSTSGGQLNPKGCISKPIRRRSRASKRTPTTLLNASTTNFRALVQQFTGSRSATLSFGSRRGPANLDFALASQQNDLHTTSMAASFGYSHNFQQNQAQQQQQQQQQQEQQMQQEQPCMFQFDNNIIPSDVYQSNCGNPTPNNMQALDDFLLENIFYV